MDRRARLLGSVNRTRQILEIGAGYTPVAPKSDGWRTHTVDHASQEDLRLKYAGYDAAAHLAMVEVDAIEEVDTIWIDGPLHEAVPDNLHGKVDLVIASHVLEHIPDLIGFFASASRLVSPMGLISAALPDRRYCFDCYKPWSTTGELLDAHSQKLSRHTLKTAFNHMAYSASSDGQLGWSPGPIDVPDLMDPFQTAATVAACFHDQPKHRYQDYHAWQFSPAGFRLAMLEMAVLEVSDWHVKSLEASGTFEFFVLLCRGASPAMDTTAMQRLRQKLLTEQLVEAREQIDFILGPGARSTGSAGPDDNSDSHFTARAADVDKANADSSATRAPAHPINTIWHRIRRSRKN